MSTDKSILVSQNEGCLKLTLNRPKSYNSFNREMALLLQEELEKAKSNPEIRVVIITGSGKAFSAGQDLVEVTDQKLNPGFKNILEEHYNPIVRQITSLKKPVIAAVNGIAAGAGANIALACDLVVAHEKSAFLQAFINIGLVPDSGGSYTLPRLVGLARAKAMMMLGKKVSAQEAEKIGMIYKCVPTEEFESVVDSLAHKLANSPTLALGLIKSGLHASYENNLDDQLKLERDNQLLAASSEDYTEGVNSFLEKRKANFKGK